jgi:ribosome modulation factor
MINPAFLAGYSARRDGRGLDANPHEYPEWRTLVAFWACDRSQWFAGWTAAERVAFDGGG